MSVYDTQCVSVTVFTRCCVQRDRRECVEPVVSQTFTSFFGIQFVTRERERANQQMRRRETSLTKQARAIMEGRAREIESKARGKKILLTSDICIERQRVMSECQ